MKSSYVPGLFDHIDFAVARGGIRHVANRQIVERCILCTSNSDYARVSAGTIRGRNLGDSGSSWFISLPACLLPSKGGVVYTRVGEAMSNIRETGMLA